MHNWELHRNLIQEPCSLTRILILTGALQFRSEIQSVRLYQSPGGLHIFVMASEAIYFLFIIYYMFVQVKVYFYFIECYVDSGHMI